ncbi:hypothetical protein PR202_gb05808 [Eleusine coracana subsp. coracana]|uniref:Glutamate/phenylalanine/leucine/valine/L-tryptophan dehydrogenase C-terminal domain-containing protein n=1 Tax=Eleusine coracana subsp. coracana TaxID=191504 RepID=A0AAV5E8W0_ELECO|nr:hypothetical protein PR202_gb05808 [Eleusine coracana subsp. coracana]
MNSAMDEINLLRQAQRQHQHQHHLVVRGIGEEIDLEIGPGDEPSLSSADLVAVTSAHDTVVPADDHKSLLIPCSQPSAVDGQAQQPPPPPAPSLLPQQGDEHDGMLRLPTHTKKKKKVVKKWREEWADTYKWAYVAVHDNTTRIFCSVCKEYGRKHRRNPYGNEGSRNMQMSALEEHNNSLLHKEALRLQMASKEKLQPPEIERPAYVKVLSKTAASILESVLRRDPYEAEFIQSIQEVVHSLESVLVKNTQYVPILERLLEPERCFIFRVPWVDDRGEPHVNRGFRVQFSQALGPCRGGLRFHPSMNLSVAKFLAFEQTLKNALSLYKLGGAAGGSDFDPKGKSHNEIMRFCQSFMDELYRYLGPEQDFPAEDIGVGPREMGYLFGQYRRLSGHFQDGQGTTRGRSREHGGVGDVGGGNVEVALNLSSLAIEGVRCGNLALICECSHADTLHGHGGLDLGGVEGGGSEGSPISRPGGHLLALVGGGEETLSPGGGRTHGGGGGDGGGAHGVHAAGGEIRQPSCGGQICPCGAGGGQIRARSGHGGTRDPGGWSGGGGNFTGPKIFWSGSSFRTEATGYGLVFFARLLLAEMNKELKGLRYVISGSGKIAMHVLEKLLSCGAIPVTVSGKLLSCGAIPVTVSDSKGYLLDEDGFDYMKYSLLRDIKAQQRSLKEYLKSYPHAKYMDDAKPWSEQHDVAFPCASHNEIDHGEAVAIINSGCRVLIECSNMPCTVEAVDILRTAKVTVAPAKATAAGGVALGELELHPEFTLMQLSVEDFENKIQDAIKQTYERSIKAAQDYGVMKENPEFVPSCLQKMADAFTWFSIES